MCKKEDPSATIYGEMFQRSNWNAPKDDELHADDHQTTYWDRHIRKSE